MSFEHIFLFFLLLVPFVAFSFLLLTNKEAIERVFSKKVLDRIKINDSHMTARARKVLFLISIFFMIVAMAHPYIENSKNKVKLSGLDVLMALDISGSMRSKDRYPNRLEFAKIKLKHLLDAMPEDNVMLLAFNDSVYMISPFTEDKDSLKSVIDGISDKYLGGGSNFTLLANSAKDILKDKSPKILVLFSDGGEKKDLKGFKDILKENNIILYTVLIGTKEGAVILDNKNNVVIKKDLAIRTKVNEELGKISRETGGDYIIANYDNLDVIKLLLKNKDKYNSVHSDREIEIDERVELFYYPLIIAFIFLFASMISLPNSNSFKRGK